MAMARRRIIVDSDDDLDGFSSLRLSPPTSIKTKSLGGPQRQLVAKTPRSSKLQQTDDLSTPAAKTATRRRKLGNIGSDASLLRPWGEKTPAGKFIKDASVAEIDLPFDTSPEPRRPRQVRPRIELRLRKSRRVSDIPADESGELSTEEASVLEDVTLEGDGTDDEDEDEDVVLNRRKTSTRKRTTKKATPSHSDVEDSAGKDGSSATDTDITNSITADNNPGSDREVSTDSEAESETQSESESDASEFQDFSASDGDFSIGSLDDYLARPPPRRKPEIKASMRGTAAVPSQLQETPNTYTEEESSMFFSAEESFHDQPSKSKATKTERTRQSSTPPKEASLPVTAKSTGLLSPSKKLPRIPQTPHRPNTDAFWDQTVVDDWNTEHSPRKLLFDPDARKNKEPTTKTSSGPTKTKAAASASDATSLKKSTGAMPSPLKKTATAAQGKEAKKLFQQAKHDMAEKFLAELDTTITKGELSRLAAATGGVRIEWTNKLNTTAGRANWRRETLRPKATSTIIIDDDDSTASAASKPSPSQATRVLHHASIELAEKVIDDEHRLLNVIAHEFCHLANFMVSGITGNPHGKEFKAWAAQCSRHFGDRGIQVTTKHAYEIDFKYVWTCEVCATEFKRHSKSIDPARHRCGACKGMLKQTKPTPRGAGAKAAGTKGAGAGGGSGAAPGPSEYQKFMKEHMAVVRRENPSSPQKDIMRLVADKWSKAKELKLTELRKEVSATETADPGSMDQLDKAFVDLTLG